MQSLRQHKQKARQSIRLELARLDAELEGVRAELIQSNQEVVQFGAAAYHICSLLQRLSSSQLGHDSLRDVTQLLGKQQPAAAASITEAIQD